MRAGDLNPDAVALLELDARSHQVDLEPVDLAGFEQLRLFEALVVARPHDAFGHVVGLAVGIDIDELRDEIGVHGVARSVQNDLHRPGDAHRLFDEVRRIDEHIAAAFDFVLLSRSGRRRRAAAVVAADAGHRVVGVVGVAVNRLAADRLVPGERAVAALAVGLAVAVEVHLGVLGARNGVFVLPHPLVRAHREELDGRLFVEAVLDTLEPVVVPAQ